MTGRAMNYFDQTRIIVTRILIIAAYDLPEALAVIGQVPMLGILGSNFDL